MAKKSTVVEPMDETPVEISVDETPVEISVDETPVEISVDETPVEISVDETVGVSKTVGEEVSVEDYSWIFNSGVVGVGFLLGVRGKETFRKLCKEERVSIIIPYDVRENRGRYIPKEVIINGLKFVLPKNTQILVPKSVADQVMASLETSGIEEIPNSRGESLLINSSEEAKRYFGM